MTTRRRMPQKAGEHQAAADYHGEHGGAMAVDDPSAEVTPDASYDSDDYSAADCA